MVKRDELIQFIHKKLGRKIIEQALQKDELANGVQILGGEEVDVVALGVSLNEDFLAQAIKRGSNFCLLHHGFDPRTYKSRYPLFSQKRLRAIFRSQMSILAFHYALDAHPRLGNNATIIRKLGAKREESLFEEWGYTGVFSTAQDVNELAKKCSRLFNHDVFSIQSGPRKIKTIGVVSGAAKPEAQHLGEMKEKGVELFISGETAESVPHKMKESNINYFVCGHYATEAFGVQELGKQIQKYFNKRVDVEFIDIPNPY